MTAAIACTARSGRTQRGVSLVEALVAMGVMAFGMLGVVGMQATLRTHADVSKQRAEAVRIAQAAVEDWRAFESLTAPGGCAAVPTPPSFDCIANVGATTVVGYATNTTYTYSATVQPVAPAASAPRLKTVAVNVAWADRNGTAQSVGLISSVAGIAPEISGSLGLPGDRFATQRPRGIHAGFPPGTVDRGNGTSTFTPPASGAPTYVFSNQSGLITSRCNPYPSSCIAVLALPLSGYVRFATGTTAPTGTDAEIPPGTAFSVGVAITQLTLPVSPAFPPACYTHLDSPGGYVSYFCEMPTTIGGPQQWSGRSELTGLPTSPAGTASTDATATNYKVCRYTPVRSHTPPGGNPEHPLDYVGVTVPLANQNFLVIRAGDGTAPFVCPADVSGTPINGNTYFHQPSA